MSKAKNKNLEAEKPKVEESEVENVVDNSEEKPTAQASKVEEVKGTPRFNKFNQN
jgi:hypothetical protein